MIFFHYAPKSSVNSHVSNVFHNIWSSLSKHTSKQMYLMPSATFLRKPLWRLLWLSGHDIHHHPSGSLISVAVLSLGGGAGCIELAEVSRSITCHTKGFFFFFWAFGVIAGVSCKRVYSQWNHMEKINAQLKLFRMCRRLKILLWWTTANQYHSLLCNEEWNLIDLSTFLPVTLQEQCLAIYTACHCTR